LNNEYKIRKGNEIILYKKIISLNIMEVHIYLKGKQEATIFKGERIDILDINLQGKEYKQIRYFRKGISKSQYISVDLINKIKTLE